MKTLLIVFVALFAGIALAQNPIQGSVRDAKTEELLPFANVYINNTTKGVQTDDQGNFSLQNPPTGTVQLVVSYLGYEPFQQTLNIEPNKPLTLNIRLTPLANMLSDVEVKAKRDKDWERKLKVFKREFLGELSNANKCEILNAWVIDFQEQNGELRAIADRPIEITNAALGYKLYVNLLSFSNSTRGNRFLTTIRYEELLPKDDKEKKRWVANRQTTFVGSSRRFFKSLYHNTLEADGYVVYKMEANAEWATTNVWSPSKSYQKGINMITNSGQLLQGVSPTQKRLTTDVPFEVTEAKRYVSVPSQNVFNANPQTRMRLLKPTYVSAEGILSDPTAVEFLGFWGAERVADFLPLDFSLQFQNIPSTIAESPVGQKVYLHTNKSGYTTTERIWVSAYITEAASNRPWPRPQPLYLQLFDADGFWVKNDAFYTEAGRGAGYLSLPDGLKTGVYRLRAFTKQTLNTPSQVFEKQLVLVNAAKPVVVWRAASPLSQRPTDTLTVRIIPDKNRYAPREKITLKLQTLLGDKAMTGSFSASVVDVNKAIENPEDFDIISYLTHPPNNPQKPIATYAEERGLTYRGVAQNENSKKPIANASITLLLTAGDKTSTRLLQADIEGKFILDNVDFDGTQILAYQINNAKGNKLTDAELVLESDLPKPRLGVIRFDTTALTTARRISLQTATPDGQAFVMPSDGKTLDEVKITAKAPELDPNEVGVLKLYNEPTYSVSFDENSPRFTNIFDMLAGTIPGLQVASFFDGSGQVYRILIRGISTFNASAIGAMTLLDGMQVSQETLLSINPNDVMRIDVLSGPNAAIFGSNGGNGVVAFYTRRFRSKYSGVPAAKTLVMNGYQTDEPFYAPNYQSPRPEHQNSDTRITIYWNPTVKTDTNGETTLTFYAADTPSRYKIVVEGMTSTGLIGRGVAWVEVQP